MPVAAAMVLILEPGNVIAVRSRASVSANVVYCFIPLTSIEKVRTQGGDSVFFFRNTIFREDKAS